MASLGGGTDERGAAQPEAGSREAFAVPRPSMDIREAGASAGGEALGGRPDDAERDCTSNFSLMRRDVYQQQETETNGGKQA